jgi:hypothetical protein
VWLDFLDGWFMVFYVTFNNISIIFWWRKPEYLEKTTDPVASHWQTWSHNVVSSTPHHEWGLNSQL